MAWLRYWRHFAITVGVLLALFNVGRAAAASFPCPSGASPNQEWSGSGTLDGNCFVGAGQTLTIDPGATITVTGAFGLYLEGPGNDLAAASLTANGSSDSPIVFQGNGSGAGQWKGIAFEPGSSGSLSFVQILNAGSCCLNPTIGGAFSSAFLADGASPTLDHVTIDSSGGNAVEVNGTGNPTLTNDTFTNNASSAVAYDNNDLPATFTQDQNLVATGNGANVVNLPGGTFTTAAAWDQSTLGIPLFINGNLFVGAGASFTVAPGSALQFASGVGLYANTTANSGSTPGGVLTLHGTQAQPITLSGTTHAAGFWKGLGIGSSSTVSLDFVHLSDAGFNALNPNEGGAYHVGIIVLHASPTIADTTVDDLPSGIYALATADNLGFPTLSNDTFVGNNIQVSPDGLSLLSNVTLQGDGLTIDVNGGTLAQDDTWPNAGTPYRLLNNLFVPTNLVVPQPITLSVTCNCGLYVLGSLAVTGTVSSPVTFQGTGSGPGQWKGIAFQSGSTGSLSNVDILNAGECCLNPTTGGGFATAFLALDSSPTLDQVRIDSSNAAAVEASGSGNPILTNDTFTNNASAAVSYDSNDLPTTFTQDQNLVATGNGANVVNLPGGTFTAAASWDQSQLGLPLVVNGNLFVEAGASVAVAPGSALQFASGFGLYANASSGSTPGGILTLQGTPAQPISISGATHSAGFWKGLGIGSGSTVSLDFVHLSDAGFNGLNPNEGGSYQTGIVVLHASPTIADTTVDDLPAGIYGLETIDNQGFPTLTNDTFVGNDILVSPDGLNLLSNVTLQGTGLTIDLYGGSLAQNDTWPNAGTPYRLLNNLFIPTSLVIPQPITMSVNCNCGLYVLGSLTVTGTIASPVTFQGTGSGPGQWKGIAFQTGSTGSLTDAQILNPGECCLNPTTGGGFSTAFLVEGTSPTLDHVLIQNSAANAVEVNGGGSPVFTDDTFTGNNGWAILFDFLPSSFTAQSLTATGNAHDAISIPTGTLTRQSNWNTFPLGIPVILSGNVVVASGGSLAFQPETTIQVSCNCGIYVEGPSDTLPAASLSAPGVSGSPITFEGTGTGAGQWKGIAFESGSTGSLSFVQILDAGSCCLNPSTGGSFLAAFLALGSAPTLDHVTIDSSGGNAVEVNGTGNPTLTNDTFTNNASSAVSYDSNDLPATFTQDQNLVATGNGANVVNLPGGTFTTAAAWDQSTLGIPLFINGNLFVGAGASFTVAPGSALQFASGVGLYANTTANSGSTPGGVLTLHGTQAQPITLSGTTHAAGFWKGLGIGSSSTVSLDFVHLSDAGFNALNPNEGGAYHVGIIVLHASPTIADTTVDDLPSGIYALATEDNLGFPTLSNDTFVGNDIQVSPDGLSLLSNVTLQGDGLTIDVNGGTLAQDDTWPNAGTPYRLLTNLIVPTNLVVPQPITMSVNCNCGLYVLGSLAVTGTVSSPVTFQGTGSGPGQWKGIAFQPGSSGSLGYTQLLNAGECCLNPTLGGSFSSAFLAEGSSPTLDHVLIDSSRDNAVEVVSGGNPTLTSDTFTNNGGSAVTYAADLPTLPISFIQDHNLVATGNGSNAVNFPGGVLNGTGAWDQASLGIPLILNGNVSVGSGATLQLSAGSTYLVAGNLGFYVRGPSDSAPGGLLLAPGTANSPITFNGTNPTPGFWKGIGFEPGSAGTLDHLQILNAGNCCLNPSFGGSYLTSFLALGANPILGNSTILGSGGNDVENAGGALSVLHDNTFGSVPGGSVAVSNDGWTSGGQQVDATNNWWGDPSGPSGGGQSGSGVAVGSGVFVTPWLCGPLTDCAVVGSVARQALSSAIRANPAPTPRPVAVSARRSQGASAKPAASGPTSSATPSPTHPATDRSAASSAGFFDQVVGVIDSWLIAVGLGPSTTVAQAAVPAAPEGANASISIDPSGFSQTSVTVSVGDTLTWTNNTSSSVTLLIAALYQIYLPDVQDGSGTTSTSASARPADVAAVLGSCLAGPQPIQPKQSFSCAFSQPGTFTFQLANNPAQVGQITVLALQSSPSPTSVETATATGTATVTTTSTPTVTNSPTITSTPTNTPTFVSGAVALSHSVASNLAMQGQFLYAGPSPIQFDVSPTVFVAQHEAIIRGSVTLADNTPLSGVTVSVLNHPEFGETLTQSDGSYNLALNGGGLLTLSYSLAGFPNVERTLNVPWQDYTFAPPVVMLPFDPNDTLIDLTQSTPIQVARGSVISDTDGVRQATLFFPAGTGAQMVFPDGHTQPITSLHVHATEFTVGANGSNAMPGELPINSSYTYATEFSVDEAQQAGATSVQFSPNLTFYLEDFLNFPTGNVIPVGYFDRTQGHWVAATNGVVVKILQIQNGAAVLDVDGSGSPASPSALASLGISSAELQELAQLYSAGQSLERVPVPHFSAWDEATVDAPQAQGQPPPPGNPWDYNQGSQPQTPAPTPDITPTVTPTTTPDCQNQGSSIIDCTDQVVQEDLPIAGSQFEIHYKSNRVPDFLAGNAMVIPLTGSSISPTLAGVQLQIQVAGQLITQSFPAQPNLSYNFVWNGRNGFNVPLQGAQPISIQVGYTYPAVYERMDVPSNYDAVFGHFTYYGAPISANPSRTQLTLWQYINGTVGGNTVGGWDQRSLGLGGWSIDPVNVYDPIRKTLYGGDGSQISVQNVNYVISPFAALGRGAGPNALAVGSDGTLYAAASGLNQIEKIPPTGTPTVIAGTGTAGFSGDGGPATSAQLNGPRGLAVGLDGSVYVADQGNQRIRKIAPNGTISTVAGTGTPGFSGDFGPATQAQLNQPFSVAVSRDGTVYVADTFNNRVRAIGPDGVISTIAGTGVYGSTGDGAPAAQASLAGPYVVAVDPQGVVYVTDQLNNRVRQITGDGMIHAFAGNGSWGFAGDTGPAAQAELNQPQNLATAADGSVSIADFANFRIRQVSQSGTISTVAGFGACQILTTYCTATNGASPTQAFLGGPSALALAPDGTTYVTDYYSGQIFRLSPPLPGFTNSQIAIPSSDGTKLFQFDPNGRHLATFNTLTGGALDTFGYDASGRLVTITDANGNVTTIQHDASGNPTAIVGPFGQTTTLTTDPNGFLASVADPNNNTYHYAYTGGGLLLSLTDPRGNVGAHLYDSIGHIIKDQHADGGSQTLARIDGSSGSTITSTTAMNRTTSYQLQNQPDGSTSFSVTDPSGGVNAQQTAKNGTVDSTKSDGTSTTALAAPDPRFEMQAPITQNATFSTPGGLTSTTQQQSMVFLSDPNNLLSVATRTDTETINGNAYTAVYDAATHQQTITSPAGRTTTSTIDNQGRTIARQVGNLTPITYAFNTLGQLVQSIDGNESTTNTYDSHGNLASTSDAAGDTTTNTYDAASRLTAVKNPVGKTYRYGYDATGNLTSVTSPNGGVAQQTFDPMNRLTSFTPPGGAADQTSYNLDGDISQKSLADGRTISYSYDAGGRATGTTFSEASLAWSYGDATTRPSGVSWTAANSGPAESLAYQYDGQLVTQQAFSGAATGTYAYQYNNNLLPSQLTLDSNAPINRSYDGDQLLIGDGPFTLQRAMPNGAITQIGDGTLSVTVGYDSQGRVTSRTTSVGGNPADETQLSYDQVGRIVQRIDTTGGASHTYAYTYDPASQLLQVTRDNSIVEKYSYDGDGNRVSVQANGGSAQAATYDAQDRLTQQGSVAFQYTASGFLTSRGAATFQYNALGELMSATVGGQTVQYAYDGLNRRVSRTDSAGTTQFLYGDVTSPGRVTASRDPGGNLTQYYYDDNGALYAFERGTSWFYVATDQLGSPVLVADASGNIQRAISYDSFGNVLTDSNPSFALPIGFGGGLADPVTGLVNFAARDYDPTIGRWTARDPVLLDGGQLNLYLYLGNNPVNGVDRQGTDGSVSSWSSFWSWLAQHLTWGAHSPTCSSEGAGATQALIDVEASGITGMAYYNKLIGLSTNGAVDVQTQNAIADLANDYYTSTGGNGNVAVTLQWIQNHKGQLDPLLKKAQGEINQAQNPPCPCSSP
jgi:RHS repeat-associated protein